MAGLIELPLQDTIDTHTAARMARVSESTVRRWCDEGRIAAVRPAGRWRIYRSEYLAWIKPDYTPVVAAVKRSLTVAALPAGKRARPRVETLPLFPE